MRSFDDSSLPVRSRSGPPVLASTRIRFRRPLDLLRAWLKFRKLYSEVHADAGLLRGSVAIVDVHTLINVSIWRSRWDMIMWSGSDKHVRTVQWTYRRVTEVWSADWQLGQMSASAQDWSGRLMLRTTSAQGASHEMLELAGESAAKR